jgi:hypothetical protein
MTLPDAELADEPLEIVTSPDCDRLEEVVFTSVID